MHAVFVDRVGRPQGDLTVAFTEGGRKCGDGDSRAAVASRGLTNTKIF